MKATVNKYAEITPTFFGLVDFEEHKEETFGSSVLIEGETLYSQEEGEWIAKHKVHQSENGTVYFESKNTDLIIGKIHPEGFRVMKVENYFKKGEKRPPQIVLEVFDEIIEEMENTDQLNKLLNNLNINFKSKQQ